MITNILALRKILEAQTSRAMSTSQVSVISMCCLGAGRSQWVSLGTFKEGVLVAAGGLRGKIFKY